MSLIVLVSTYSIIKELLLTYVVDDVAALVEDNIVTYDLKFQPNPFDIPVENSIRFHQVCYRSNLSVNACVNLKMVYELNIETCMKYQRKYLFFVLYEFDINTNLSLFFTIIRPAVH